MGRPLARSPPLSGRAESFRLSAKRSNQGHDPLASRAELARQDLGHQMRLTFGLGTLRQRFDDRLRRVQAPPIEWLESRDQNHHGALPERSSKRGVRTTLPYDTPGR